MTFSLGWVLAKSERFLALLLKDLTGRPWDGLAKAVVRLQTGVDSGITDVEVELTGELCVVFEAKSGAVLPDSTQILKYANVLTTAKAETKLIVALTNATPVHVGIALHKVASLEIPLTHRSWREILLIAKIAGREEIKNANKQWLKEFTLYLEGVLSMETRYSNRTFVVSLGQGSPDGWRISWIGIVEQKAKYFFPVGEGWPDPPPNYIALRYKGVLQTIRHVENYSIFTRPKDIFAEAVETTWQPHYCLSLGPPIRPAAEVRNGPRVHMSARVWCMLDTLLTNPTISAALSETERRTGETGIASRS